MPKEVITGENPKDQWLDAAVSRTCGMPTTIFCIAHSATSPLDLRPAKRFAEIADIADAIIKTLLPDDEDNCRDTINDDYQLKSDIETFEHFTGKPIRSKNDEPSLGDEIEMEDIERSL